MKFLVVDDHTLIREALRDVLCDLRSGSTVLEAGDSCQALTALRLHSEVDLVLLDRHLPDRDGLDVLDEMRRTYPAVPVVMLSGDKDQVTINQALRRGALGFIPKSETRGVLSSALALVLAGGSTCRLRRWVPRLRRHRSRQEIRKAKRLHAMPASPNDRSKFSPC